MYTPVVKYGSYNYYFTYFPILQNQTETT